MPYLKKINKNCYTHQKILLILSHLPNYKRTKLPLLIKKISKLMYFMHYFCWILPTVQLEGKMRTAVAQNEPAKASLKFQSWLGISWLFLRLSTATIIRERTSRRTSRWRHFCSAIIWAKAAVVIIENWWFNYFLSRPWILFPRLFTIQLFNFCFMNLIAFSSSWKLCLWC